MAKSIFEMGSVMTSSKKYIYSFEEGDGKNKMLLGGKGANLCEMTQIGLNVPPGFTITTDACNVYLEKNKLPDGLMPDIKTYMLELEKKTGKGFGSGTNPLLVSVRSGSSMSMPGTSGWAPWNSLSTPRIFSVSRRHLFSVV